MWRARLARVNLGLAAAAMFQGVAWGQDTTQARRDSVQRAQAAADSMRAASDSARARADRARADSIKPALAHAERPPQSDIGTAYQWDRVSLFASGALTLGELTDLVPGVTGYRSGWIGSPHVAAYLGETQRVRVFYEGIEIDALDRRAGGLLDLSMFDMWHLEDARIERGADEVRVHLGTWRVQNMTPATRVDFSTGDLETNAYRAYYGKRFARGQAVQLGVYQYSSTDLQNGGDVHHLSLWGRTGWANKQWSVDASWLRTARERLEQERLPPGSKLPVFDGAISTAYARIAYGHQETGPWAQVIMSQQQFTIHNPPVTVIDSIPGPAGGGPLGSPVAPDTISVSGDTTRARPQYLLTGGWAKGPLHFSGANRIRVRNGTALVSPGVRAAYESPRATVAFYGERSASDSLLRAEVTGRVQILSSLTLGGALGRTAPISGRDAPTSIATRVEVGTRLKGLTVTAGVVTRDTAKILPPIVFDTSFRAVAVGKNTGTFATIRGKFWRDVGLDVWAVKYGAAAPYLPQYQARSKLFFDSGLEKRYPSGNLHILFAVTHEYRSRALFPIGAATPLTSSQYRVWGAILEIRLLTATLSYQYRNFLNAEYSQVPGFLMPHPVNFYGVRWNFID